MKSNSNLQIKIYYLIISIFFSINIFAHKPPESMKWRNVGPTRGGRVTAVCGVNKIPGTFYQGATGGGLWKTTDYGYTWKNISDGYFASPSIGAIAVYQKKPDIIYVGTGSDGIRSNIIVGKGMYKSMDNGNTWSFIGLKNAGQIGSVIIHPDNPNIVYAAAIGQPFRKSKERGVYKTTDGGKNWNNVFFLSDSVGALDLEFAPDDSEIIYVSMWRAERKPWTIISGGATDGIYKTIDGGNTWSKMTQGLPKGLVGKIDFAVSMAKPERLWAQIQASDGQEGIYISDDYAESWKKIEMPKKTHKSAMYRPFYFTNLSVNPKNADHILTGTKIFWSSHDAGKTWEKLPVTHSDHHDLWINPVDTSIMIEGNDGGAAISRDGGQTWSSLFNQPTAELYSCYVDDQYPYYLYSGQQDNSAIRTPSSRPYLDVLLSNDNHNMNDVLLWEDIGGCETGPAIAKPGDPNTIYANCKGQFTVYSRITGKEQNYYIGAESLYSNHPDDITYRFQRVTPMEVSPHNPNVVYYGSQYLHKTSNGGKNWEQISPDLTANDPKFRMRSGGPIDEDISGEEYYGVLYAIRESPLRKGEIWTGSNDGLFYLTKDGGENWNNITPDMPGGGRVSNIEVSPYNPAKAYYAVYRDYLGDDKPYLYKTEDYGKTWTKIINGIPSDYPIRVVREDPDREGLLYAGTELGLFISFDDGNNWKPFQLNLPVVPVTDIKIIRKDIAISTLGRSFWILDDISVLHNFDPESINKFQFFKPKDIINLSQNFYFTLPEEKKGKVVSIEVIRDDTLIHSHTDSIAKIPTNKLGIYKLEWDMRYHFKLEEEDFAGPMVSPGKYSVKLIYNSKTINQSFKFLLHPELELIGTCTDNLKEQEKLGLKIVYLLINIKKEIGRLESEIEKVRDKKKIEEIKAKLDILKKGPKRYDKPKLYEHTEYLYKMIMSSQQKPGDDAYHRHKKLEDDFNKYLKKKCAP